MPTLEAQFRTSEIFNSTKRIDQSDHVGRAADVASETDRVGQSRGAES